MKYIVFVTGLLLASVSLRAQWVYEGTVAAVYNGGASGFVQLWNDNALIWKRGNQWGGLRLGNATDLGASGWAERIRITDAGNVGIGSTGPGYPLTIDNDGPAWNSHGRAKYPSIMVNAGNRTGAGIAIADDGGFFDWNDNYITYEPLNDNGLGLRISNSNLTVDNNVAIGTTSPRGKLDVWGGSLYVTGADIQGTFVAGAQAGIAYMGCNAFNNGIAIMPNGYVGIGTNDTKGYRFAVNGDAIFTKVKVKPYPWADYVFHASYKLRPLNEVEQYIKQHHHLPEVPSAAAVEKDGLDVGDNQAMLLKKIEELTLYVIEQNKKLEEQNKKQQVQNEKLQELDRRVNALQQENDRLKDPSKR